MSKSRVYLWRSPLAQQFYQELSATSEGWLLRDLLAVCPVTSDALLRLHRHWHECREQHSLLECLIELGWSLPNVERPQPDSQLLIDAVPDALPTAATCADLAA